MEKTRFEAIGRYPPNLRWAMGWVGQKHFWLAETDDTHIFILIYCKYGYYIYIYSVVWKVNLCFCRDSSQFHGTSVRIQDSSCLKWFLQYVYSPVHVILTQTVRCRKPTIHRSFSEWETHGPWVFHMYVVYVCDCTCCISPFGPNCVPQELGYLKIDQFIWGSQILTHAHSIM